MMAFKSSASKNLSSGFSLQPSPLSAHSAQASSLADNKELRHEDLVEFLNVFSQEFNSNAFHDRVLVFEIQGKEKEASPGSFVENIKETENTVFGSEKVIPPADERPSNDTEEASINETGNIESGSEKVVHSADERPSNDAEEASVNKTENIESGSEKVIHSADEQPSNDTEEASVNKTDDQQVIQVLTDIEDETKIKANQTKLFVHSCWLAVQSSYFKALFYTSGMKESNSKEVFMKVEEDELEAHLTLVEAMYTPDILNDEDYSLVCQVLVLADKYDVRFAFKKCKYVLMATEHSLEICEFILDKIKHLTNCGDLLDVLQNFLVEKFSPLDKTWTGDKFLELSTAAIKLLLSSDKLAVGSENTVFVALMEWMEFKHLSKVLELSLLQLVRFELMSLDFLYDVVKNHDVARSIVGFNDLLQKGLAYNGFSKKRKAEMKLKPVNRASFDDSVDPTFVWVIDKNTRTLLLKSGKDGIFSDSFWYKGYEIYLSLQYDNESSTFGFYVYLKSISDYSFLHLNVSTKSNLFPTKFKSHLLDSKYTGVHTAWGWPSLECIDLKSVSGDASHTIEVQVKILP